MKKILWGPFQQRELDLLVQHQLQDYDLQSFGPYGSDLLWYSEHSQMAQLQAFKRAKADYVLLIEPFQRFIPEVVFELGCPVIACSSERPALDQLYQLFDGYIPIWQAAEEFDNHHILLGQSWVPECTSKSSVNKKRFLDLVVAGDGLDPETFSYLQRFYPQALFLQGLAPDKAQAYFARARRALIPSKQANAWHLEALNNGLSLLLPAYAPLLNSLRLKPEQYQCFKLTEPVKPVESALSALSAPLEPWRPAGLNTILGELFTRLEDQVLTSYSEKRQAWQNYSRLMSLNQCLAYVPKPPEYLPLDDNLESRFAQVLVSPAETAAPELLALWKLLKCEDFCPKEAYPVLLSLANQPLIQTMSQSLKWPGLNFKLQVLVACLRSGLISPQQLPPEELKTLEPWLEALWPDLQTWLKAFEADPAWVEFLLKHLGWKIEVRALAATLLPESYQAEFMLESFSLLRRQPFWQQQKLEALESLLPAKTTSGRLQVLWEGTFYYYHFARAHQPLLEALSQADEFSLILADTSQPLQAPVWPELDFRAPFEPPEIVITHHFPHREYLPAWGKQIAVMPWEFGVPPKFLAEIIRDKADEVWVHSEFCRQSYLRVGGEPERLQVIPQGVDTQLYCPEGPQMALATSKSFRFCFVGGAVPHKGIDLLLETYLTSFGPEEDVCLVIKNLGMHDQDEAEPLINRIQAYTQDPQKPEILLLSNEQMTDQELSSLYRACDVYVCPYRGERFGQQILDAMSCGLPVIIPELGPAPEFCPAESSWQIASLYHFMNQSFFSESIWNAERFTELPSFWIEPDAHFLSQTLKAAAADPELCRQKGRFARQAALAYDWSLIAEQVKARILAVAQLPGPKRLLNSPTPATLTVEPLAVSLPACWQTLHFEHLIQVPPEQAQLSLSFGTESTQANICLVPARTPADAALEPEFSRYRQFWFEDQADALAWGRAKGVVIPPALDFDFYRPVLQNLQVSTYELLSISDPRSWPELLQAFAELNVGKFKVRLTLIATPDSRVPKIELTLPASHQIRRLELPAQPESIRKIFEPMRCFVDVWPESSGRWHLIAQAMGIRTISAGGRSWLERPFCETISGGDVQRLSWLFAKLLPARQTIRDALAVREHIKPVHDLPAVGKRLESALLKVFR